jgi:hypothetical protein
MANEFQIKHGLIVSGSADIEQDLRVRGTLTVGDSSDDTHEFTGSVNITGSISLNGEPIGTGKLNETTFQSYTSSNDSRVSNLETSTGSLNSFTSSINTTIKSKLDNDGVISSSAQVNFTGTTGYSTFTDSLSSTVLALSSSIATTELNLANRLISVETKTGSYATTGSNLFKGTQTHSGSILPSVDNAYDLGSVEYQWRDVYISSGSLYIDGTKVLSSTAQELTITTDSGQSIKILESGTDSIILQTADGDIELKSNADGDILLDPTNGKIMLKGPVEIFNGNKIQSSVNGTPVVFASDIVVSGSIDLTGTIDGIDLQSLSSSLNTRIGSIEISTGSLNSFTSSASSRLNSIETVTSSFVTYSGTTNSRLTSIESSTSSLNSFTSSANSRLNSIESSTGSLNNYTGSNNTIIGTLQTATGALNSYTGSNTTNINAIHTATSSLNSFTSSINTTIKNRLNTEGVISGSSQIILTGTTGYSTFSSSVATSVNDLSSSINSLNSTDTSHNTRLTTIESRYATTGSNVFKGDQTITGSLYISQNLIVQGSSSLENITASAVSIGTNTIILNADTPAIRYAGISVFDSGSTNVTASLFYDSLTNNWKFQHSDVGTDDASILLYGPLGTGIDNAPTLVGNFLTKVEDNGHGHHLTTSSIFDNGSKISLKNNTEITGSVIITSTIVSQGTTLVSGSGQISYAGITNVPSGIVSGAVQVKSLLPTGTVSGSSQVLNGSGVWSGSVQLPSGIVSGSSQVSFNGITDKPALVSGSSQVSFNGITDKPTLVSGSSQITFSGLSGIPSGIVSGSSQVLAGTTIHSGSFFNNITVVSGSAQISFNGITDRPTLVSGSSQVSFTGLSNIPGGLVSGSSQIDLTATTNYSSGIKTRLNAEGVISGSSQVTGIANSQLTNSSFHVGTTSISLGRGSASQTLTGVSIDGNSATVTNGVYTTGDQTIGGAKTFSSSVRSNDVNAFILSQTGNTTDTKTWSIQNLPTSGQFRIRALNDNETNGINAIVISRTGISSLSLDFTGAATFSSSVTGVDIIANGSLFAGGSGESLGVIIRDVINTSIPSSSVKSIIGATNSGFGYAAGSLLIQPRTGVGAVTVFTTEGSERMRITSGGAIVYRGESNVNSQVFLSNDNSLFRLYAGDSSASTKGFAFFVTNGSNQFEAMRITSGGNVGIGTTDPNRTLSVVGTKRHERIYAYSNNSTNFTNSVSETFTWFKLGNATPFSQTKLYYRAGTSTSEEEGEINISNTCVQPLIQWTRNTYNYHVREVRGRMLSSCGACEIWVLVRHGNHNSGANTNFQWQIHSGTDSSFVVANTTGTPGTGTNQISINSTDGYFTNYSGNMSVAGNVGIGTTSPNNLLQLTAAAGSSHARWTEAATTVGFVGGANGIISGLNGSFAVRGESGLVLSGAGNSATMFLNTSGNVGIGTTSPNERLHVSGNISVVASGGSKIGFNTTDAFSGYGTSIAHYGMSYGWNTNPLALSGYFGIGFFTDGSEKMRILGNGNVGIGATSPTQRLDVNGYIRATSGFVGNGGLSLWGDNSSSSAGLFVTTGGNVGIGTNSPEARLQVTTGARTGGIRVGGGNGAGQNRIFIESNDGNSYIDSFGDSVYKPLSIEASSLRLNSASGGNVGIGVSNPTNKLQIGSVGSSGYGGNDIAIGNGTQVMAFFQSSTISGWYTNTNFTLMPSGAGSTGNLGVGTTTPSNRLTVSGNADFTGNVGIGTTSPSYKLDIIGTTRIVASSQALTIDGGNGALDRGVITTHVNRLTQLALVRAGVGTWGFDITSGGVAIMTAQDNSINMLSMVLSNGNVGIGTTDPGSFKLNVNGDIYANGDIRSQGIFRDYQGEALLSTNTSAVTQLGSLGAGTSRTLAFLAGNAERMRISTSGNILLNTTGGTTVGGFTNTTLSVKQLTDGLFGGGLHIEEAGTTSLAYFGFDGNTFRIGTSYRTTGDYRPISFATNGVERLRIGNNGNVGIGTNNPSQKLEVGNFLDDVTNRITVAGRYEYEPEFNFRLGQSGTNFDWIGAVISSGDDGNYNGKIQFKTANNGRDTPTTKMIIKANGNVGIGTTSPIDRFHVAGGITSTGLADSLNGQIGSIQIGHDGTNGVIRTWFSSPLIYSVFGHHQFNTNGSERMRITSGGNVGIGTTNPTRKLQITDGEVYIRLNPTTVAGSYLIAAADGKLYITPESTFAPTMTFSAGNVGIGTSSPARTLHVLGQTGIGTVLKLEGASGTTTYLQLSYNGATNAQSGYIGYDTSANMSLFTNDTERMRITSGGNVGIGTTDPTGRLDVRGGDIWFNRGTGNLGNRYLYINKGTSNDGGILLSRDNSMDWQIVNATSTGDLWIYSYGVGHTILGMERATGNMVYRGSIIPQSNGNHNLGSSSLRWNTVFTSDLSLSNGIGDYTIVEGENDLFLYNNKQNKVYKFMLQEVNAEDATPKRPE